MREINDMNRLSRFSGVGIPTGIPSLASVTEMLIMDNSERKKHSQSQTSKIQPPFPSDGT
jgi:hypothetical protein